MRLDFCAVCGIDKDLQQHHIEPVVYSKINRAAKNKKYDGNKKLKDCTSIEIFAYMFDQGIISDDETITVCSFHHNILHGIIKFQKYEHSRMIREGQINAKANGKRIGRPSAIDANMRKDIIEARKRGMGIKKIAKHFGIGVGTVYDALKKDEEHNNGTQ